MHLKARSSQHLIRHLLSAGMRHAWLFQLLEAQIPQLAVPFVKEN